mgnify:CR=1 FL=1
MLEKLRQKLLEFIYSDKDTPILAGLSVGLYVLLFYYSRNFAIANSIEQLIFYILFYSGSVLFNRKQTLIVI